MSVDLRVGGTFEIETQGADGSRHPLRFRHEIVDAPTLLVVAEPNKCITTEIRFQPSDHGTTVVSEGGVNPPPSPRRSLPQTSMWASSRRQP